MKLIETKCPNCNSNLEVENNKKKVECKYCGTTFLLDDNTVNVRHISAGQITEEQEFINAETNLNKFKNYDEAYRLYLSLSKRFVDNPEIWIGLLRCYTHDFTKKTMGSFMKKYCDIYWNNYCSLVGEAEVSKYRYKYETYMTGFDEQENKKKDVKKFFSSSAQEIKKKIEKPKKEIPEDNKCYLLLIIFLGAFGIHKFIRKRPIQGLLYLFTGGLFCIGWIIDIVKEYKKFPESKQRKAIPWLFASFFLIYIVEYFKYNPLATIPFIICGFLCLDYFWILIGQNKKTLRIWVPIIVFVIGCAYSPVNIPEKFNGKWVTSDNVQYQVIEVNPEMDKVYEKIDSKDSVSVTCFYGKGNIYVEISDNNILKLKYNEEKETLCLIDKNDKCSAKYYLKK